MRAALATLLVLAVFVGAPATAQDKWPEKSIKLVVPYPPGGISDALGRHVGRIMEKDLGQPIVVENRGGAGSNLGSDAVAKAAPDGYTILLGSTANAVNMTLYKTVAYNTLRDFAAVSLIADVPNVLVVNSALPFKTVGELIEHAKKKPDELNYASAGSGSPAHLAAELFNRGAGVQIRHVAYRGAGPAIVDVIGGRVEMMFTNLQAVFAGIDSGSLRLLGTGGTTRWPSYPNVPTIAESGVPGYEASAWYGLLVPAATPKQIIARLQKALAGVRDPLSMEAIRKLGAEPVVSTPEALQAKLEADIKSYEKLIKEAGITVD
jgi:tripartite-type tricarboxylate transporter receptor subunit TctC